jgi:hypothetical protein
MKPAPPKGPLKFLRWFCREEYLDEIELVIGFHTIRSAVANPANSLRSD